MPGASLRPPARREAAANLGEVAQAEATQREAATTRRDPEQSLGGARVAGAAESSDRLLNLFPIGPLAPAFVAEVAQRVSRAVAVPCRVIAPPAAIPVEPIESRAQVDADRLLRAVEALATPESVLAALLADDMGSPLFTHFFGRARLGGRALVVSVARLRPSFYGLPDDPAVAARRAALEVTHELGHVGGLQHCPGPRCLMHFAHTVDAIDVRGTTFCPDCARRLGPGVLGEREG